MNAVRIVLIVIVVLIAAVDVRSSGGFLPVAQFGYIREPPREAFARGAIGIVRPTYRVAPLVVAYRYLTGVPLGPQEVAVFAPAPQSPPPCQLAIRARLARTSRR